MQKRSKRIAFEEFTRRIDRSPGRECVGEDGDAVVVDAHRVVVGFGGEF